MDSLIHRAIPYLILISSLISFIAARKEVCIKTICGRRNGHLSIRFPFRITNVQPETCGYPGFDLYCDASNKTLLYIPDSGNLTVQGIDYLNQEILLNDPDDCLAKKLLSGLDLSHSPFRFKEYYNFSFYKCPEHNEIFTNRKDLYQDKISCLSTTPNHVVIGVEAKYFEASSLEPWCNVIGNVMAPWNSLYKISSLEANLLLVWDVPKCSLCESNITQCRFKREDSPLEIMCMNYDPPIASGQLSKKARSAIGLSIGAGVPVLVICVVLLVEVIRSCRRSRED